jgi:hypothetical protein
MFRTSLLIACAAATAEAFAPGAASLRTSAAPRAAIARGPMMQQKGAGTTTKLTKLTPALFTQLDKDRNGTIDLEELRQAAGVLADSDLARVFKMADKDGSGDIDYAEYERLMNLERFGEEQGGNTAVRFALQSGLLKQGSVLEDNLMVGNKGFDPAGFATSQEKLDEYREAELKHGRLAMLAAVGWPVSEYLQPILAKQIGAPDLLAAGEKAPSLLNGGFDRINPLFFLGTLAFTAAVENFGLKGGFADREPGDLGFDPLNLYYGSTEDVKYSYRLKEVNNGRLAMVAITYYAFTEFFTGTNTLEESGKVFAPFITGQPAAL